MARWSPSSALRLYRTSAQRRQLHGTRNPPGNLGDPADVNSEMAIAREEQFGPIVCLMRFDTEDQALAMVKTHPLGLSDAGAYP
jgi:acyl-CoA reductase-like NAD-dependent aldehyde dehydrogenase